MSDAAAAKPAAPAKLRGLALINNIRDQKAAAKKAAEDAAKAEAAAKDEAAKAKAAGTDDASQKAKAAEEATKRREAFEAKIDGLASKIDELLKALTA